MYALELVEVSKSYGPVRAVESVSLQVKDGEFLSLLGASGCGKTTTLRIIAGFERPDTGRIMIRGREITHEPPYRRDAGMVFQNYALFPHMTVLENVAFGLKMRKVTGREVNRRVARALELVRLEGYGGRYPYQLSGGQQQRIAVARAIVIEPEVLLLDEPLSNLDAKLREEMRVELRQIQQNIGITTIFVTHDQEEALTLSDRLAVMHQGRVRQVGTPFEIYEKPSCPFVASFIGQSNLVWGRIISADQDGVLVESETGLRLKGLPDPRLEPGAMVLSIIKQARVRLNPTPEEGPLENSFAGKVDFVNYMGSYFQYICSIEGHRVVVSLPSEGGGPQYKAGETVTLAWWKADTEFLATPEGSLG